VDYLDFWLDVAQHMSLCRLYVRELRRSVLVQTPDDPDKHSSKDSSVLLQMGADLGHGGGEYTEKEDQHRLSHILRNDNVLENGNGHVQHATGGRFDEGVLPPPPPPLGDELRDSHVSTDQTQQTSQSPTHTVARADIRASAERILYTYLLQGSEREIVLPTYITRTIASAIEVDGRDDPEVFDEAKEYVFAAIERDAFPGFLRAKALGNLVPSSSLLRLVLGLLGMFGGFWTAFALIFLDSKPKAIRLWVIIPFFVGVYGLLAHQYDLDPTLAFLGFSEATFMSFMRIREHYVRRLLVQRALFVHCLTVLIVAALTVLFTFVPGHRL